jgi:purine nucleosidase
VAGNVPEPAAAGNAASLLAAAGRRFPVHRGASQPLLRSLRTAQDVHGADGLGGALLRAELPAGSPPAVDRLRAFTDTLVAIGPLTNVATAVLCDRDWPRRVRRLVVMGGALAVGGNTTAAAEFNFRVDPEAADIVLRAGFPEILLVPLDCRRDLAFGRAEHARLQATASPLADLAQRLLQPWQGRIEAGGVAIYDAVAWMAASHPEIFRWEDLHVRVDTSGGLADGASIADRRPAAPPANVRAYAGVAATTYWDWFFEALRPHDVG